MVGIKLTVSWLTCTLVYHFLAAAHGNGVPVLMWTDTGVEFPYALSGHSKQTKEFLEEYLNKVAFKTSHVLVAFVQDKLKLEDIIDNADVYNAESDGAKFLNLKNLVETHTNVHLPSVLAPGEAVDRLARGFPGQLHHLQAPYNLHHMKLSASMPNLIIAHLPNNDGKSFDKIDAIISSVTSHLKNTGMAVTAFYTGKRSSLEEDNREYLGRHLLQESVAEDYSFYNVSNCIYMYFEQMYLTLRIINKENNVEKELRVPVPNSNDPGSGSECNSSTLVISNDQLGSGVTNFKATFQFSYKMGGYWFPDIIVSYDVNNRNLSTSQITISDRYINGDEIYGPQKFSFHCTNMDISEKRNKTGAEQHQTILSFEQFQVQYKDITDEKFGYPSDCDGFFSIPVLSALFVGFILAAIMTFGICMMVNISTMDRFDDPKGKTISVTPGE